MLILPVLILAVAHLQSDLEPDSVARMKKILAACGEQGPFRLQALASQDPPKGKRWFVKLSGPNNASFEGWFGGGVGEITVWKGPERDSYIGYPLRPLPEKDVEAKTRHWLKSIGVREQTRLLSSGVDKNGKGHAYMALLRNGYPFVSYPEYGYDFEFSVPGERFLALRAMEKPPEVDNVPPKLDEAAALAAFQRAWDEKERPTPTGVRGSSSAWYKLSGKPELGYYLQKGRFKAGLVWKISYMSFRSSRFSVRGGSADTLIDAMTGDRIPTDTVP